jgi:hypothetical protein
MPRYFRRQIGRLQNGLAGDSSADLGCRPKGAPGGASPDPPGTECLVDSLAGRRDSPPRRAGVSGRGLS